MVAGRDLENLLKRGSHLVELRIDDGTRQVLIKDVQYDHLGSTLIHVDFTRVDLSERVTVAVPLEFRGMPIGTHEGGLLEHNLVDLEVECLVTDIPESIRVNVAEMKLTDVIHVSELPLPEGVEAITPGNHIICSVRASKAADADADGVAEESAEQTPEIIGQKEKEEEESSGK
jgi:large subunit ribosomal protein L25